MGNSTLHITEDFSKDLKYSELHCHTNYSFQEGASSPEEILIKAHELEISAVAITDHDNLCGAIEFAQMAKTIGIQAIIGVELTLNAGTLEQPNKNDLSDKQKHLTLLAENLTGYKNISTLISYAHLHSAKRNYPELNVNFLEKYSEGVICLSGCTQGEISALIASNRYDKAKKSAELYLDIYGENNFFIEIQNNLVKGNKKLNKQMIALGDELGIEIVATNNVHYNIQKNHRINDVLVSIKHNTSIYDSHSHRRENDQFYLKSPSEMLTLFPEYTRAITNTYEISKRCSFDILEDPVYKFPKYSFLPHGYTELAYLKKICRESAIRKYGFIDSKITTRLNKEFSLLQKNNLIGFILQYYDIIKIAREIQEDLNLVEPNTPVEQNPPGRGRGSSVALLVGYLTGLSHIDPLKFNLKLNRFLPESKEPNPLPPPDIDLDFPREIRDELIIRVHEKWGHERSVLTGMIPKYGKKGALRDVRKVFGLSQQYLSKRRNFHENEIYRNIVEFSNSIKNFPKYLAQHPGGMILSDQALSEVVPIQKSAIRGRYICQWDKNSVKDAGIFKIDFLSLATLSHLSETLELIRQNYEENIDISRINFADQSVYDDIHKSDTIGVFQIESPAQIQTVSRLRPSNLTEMAWEVGVIRPGVGVNSGVSKLIRRHTDKKIEWSLDHVLEKKSLFKTYGIPLFQDQLIELAIDVGGLDPIEADLMRRAFTRNDPIRHINYWKRIFVDGALSKGVNIKTAEKIFKKFHGMYQFPESHAFAFGVTAYQMAWLKHYYPLEFYVGIFNNQPIGFYNLETIKEDAKRHGINILIPDINQSELHAKIESKCIRMGLIHVRTISSKTAKKIIRTRNNIGGYFKSLNTFICSTGLAKKPIDSLNLSGAFDSMYNKNLDGNRISRKEISWELGLRYRHNRKSKYLSNQLKMDLPIRQDMIHFPVESNWDLMIGEYESTGIYTNGHIMEEIRPKLPAVIIRSNQVKFQEEQTEISVAGIVIRRQRPSGKTVFITLEDEYGHSQLILWKNIYDKLKEKIKHPLLIASGIVSRKNKTLSIIVCDIEPISTKINIQKSKDWG
ncbi:MAG: DNA polymerase III subunit alpha [Dehalococcoidia bacterium]|jgi:error-prone DNA polymerase|nr:DNA polymerase III subunit alpha [Dehalococcoidia bacterium]